MAAANRQNLTVSLSREIIHKAKVLAAKRSTTISGLVADQIEKLTVHDEDYEQAHREALKLMNSGLRMGGGASVSREELHER
jgi:HSP90 family molecular chaperone